MSIIEEREKLIEAHQNHAMNGSASSTQIKSPSGEHKKVLPEVSPPKSPNRFADIVSPVQVVIMVL